MRNLKRVLSLALACVMVIGMMVMTTSAADFDDAAEINPAYVEAVDVMAGVGMFEGNNGILNPDGELTRLQAATLLARLKLGKTTADKLVATQQTFTDVPKSAWYAGEVEYCYTVGLIAGIKNADGTYRFNPEGKMNVLGFAKLLLVALGYDADAAGYVGKDWASNIAIDALHAGLTIDGVALTDPATREIAAQMLFQALTCTMVKYETAYDKATGAPVLVGPKAMTNTVVNAAKTYDGEVDGYTQFVEHYFPNLILTAGTDDMWGRPADHAWELRTGKVLYTEWEEAIAKYTEAVSDCHIAVDMGLKADAAAMPVYTNGVPGTTRIDLDSQIAENGAQGAQLEIYDGRIVRIDTYLAKVDTVVTQLKDAGGHEIRSAKNDLTVYGLEGDTDAKLAGNTYAVNDMILVNYNVTKDKYVALGLAESFVGAQTFVWWNVDKHTVNNVEYKDACKLSKDEAGIDLVANYTWYKDQFGNIIGVFAINTPKTYGIVEGVQWINTWGINGYAQANVRYMDGTTGTVIVKDVTVGVTTKPMAYADYSDVIGAGDEADDFQKGEISTVWQYNNDCMNHLYQFVSNIDGTVSLIAQAELTTATVADGISAVTGTPATIYTDNYTTYLIRTQHPVTMAYSYTLVTGYDNLDAKWTATATVDYVDYTPANGYAKYVYITGNSDAAAAAVANEYIYFTSNTRYYGDAMQNNVPCFAVGGVVDATGSTEVLYIAKDTTKTDAQNMTNLYTFLNGALDKLYKVKTTNGIVAALTDMTVANDGDILTNLAATPKNISYVDYAANGTFDTIDGNGVLKVYTNNTKATVSAAYNVNAATTIINQNGVGTITDLNNAALAGKAIYVVGAYNAAGNATTTQAVAVFITPAPVVKPNPGIEVTESDFVIKNGTIYVNGTFTGMEKAETIAAALEAAGYTNITGLTVDPAGTLTSPSVTAKKGVVEVTFTIAAQTGTPSTTAARVMDKNQERPGVAVDVEFLNDTAIGAKELTVVLYSGKVALAEAVYQKTDLTGDVALTCNFTVKDGTVSSSWGDTLVFNGSKDVVPNGAKVFVNGVLMQDYVFEITAAEWATVFE